MSDLKIQRQTSFGSIEFRLTLLLFLLLWSYVIVRAFTVFYIHDEIVTKWSYVVHWNFLPNHGNVDANNHFLLSFLAGLFTRIFNSDHLFLLRLGSVLAFPLYFWSIVRLKFLFTQKWNFYALLIALTTTSFLIEYFSLARGYGLGLAFLVFSIQQMISYFHAKNKRALIACLVGWLLTICSSLTLLPIALMAIFLLVLFTVKNRFFLWLLPIAVICIPILYFIDYSFTLKELGKLYYGGTEGFFESTVHSMTQYIWLTKSIWVDVLIGIATAFILFMTVRRFWKTKNLFDPKLLYSLFLFAGVASILAQHWLLKVNFPEDRTAMYLIIFFFVGLFLSFDEIKTSKAYAFITIGLSLSMFALTLNVTHSMHFRTEHLDEELVMKIPMSVNGTPPTTAGRWNMENSLTRKLDLPLRIYQNNDSPSDTLTDYMVFVPERRPGLTKLYDIEHLDPISGQALLKRKKLLPRKKQSELEHTVIAEAEFQDLLVASLDEPLILRCAGELKQMSEQSEIFIVFTSQDSATNFMLTYEAVPMIRNRKLTKGGTMDFDFSYAMNKVGKADSFKVYIWSPNKENISGKIKLEVYTIED